MVTQFSLLGLQTLQPGGTSRETTVPTITGPWGVGTQYLGKEPKRDLQEFMWVLGRPC